jgi:hypothetical protein
VDDDQIFADLHIARTSTELTLQTVIEWAQKAVGSAGAGVFLLRRPGGPVETVLPTSPEVAEAHELQIALGEGPCLDVFKADSQGTCIVGDSASDIRFPAWGPAAAKADVRSAMSAVMKTTERTYGSLNVFAAEPHTFDLDDLAVLDIFSRRAARAMAIAQDHEGLTKALDSRKLIGQAQGILMERFDLDDNRAFEFLTRLSQERNTKLRPIAQWIVTNRTNGSLVNPDL